MSIKAPGVHKNRPALDQLVLRMIKGFPSKIAKGSRLSEHLWMNGSFSATPIQFNGAQARKIELYMHNYTWVLNRNCEYLIKSVMLSLVTLLC